MKPSNTCTSQVAEKFAAERSEPQPLLIILAVAGVLRIGALSQMLWYDEAYTAMLAKMPIAQIVSATAGDVHPPTWYLIESAFVRTFGTSEAALRLPSAILGIAAVWLTYRLARDLLDQRAALVTAGLMSVSPFAVYYSQEARMYALLMVAVLLATLGAVERRWWLLAVGTGLTLLSHNIAVIYIPFILLATRSKWRCGILAMAAGSLPWLAWLPQLIHQATTGQFAGQYWISYFTSNRISKLLAELVQLWFPHFRPDWTSRIGALIAFALIIFPLIEAARRRARPALMLAVLAIGPGLIELGISLAWQPIILSRTLSGCLPAWCVLIAWWIMLPRQWNAPRIALISVAAGVILATTISLYGYERWPNMKMITYLKSNLQPGDLICHTSNSTRTITDFYLPGRSTNITDADAGQCTWLLDERYITTDQNEVAVADRLRAEHNGDLVLHGRVYPVITTDLYRLHQ